MATIQIDDSSTAEAQIKDTITIETAQALAKLYNSFVQNRKKISNRVTRFMTRVEQREVIEVHCENNSYQLMHPDIEFFNDGYKLLNDIRILLGQEPTNYMIGILDQEAGKAYQVELSENKFLKYAKLRGDKSALSHSMDTVESLLKNKKLEDISASFIPFVTTVENKVKEHNDTINYGYAFEAYGHFTYNGSGNKESRHDAYYNYYRAARRNTIPWTTGGDVGNLQYKLLRIYIDDKGDKQISSASISSGNLILKELSKLKNLLEQKEISPAELSYELAKSYTQINLPKNLTKSLEKKISESMAPLIEPYLT